MKIQPSAATKMKFLEENKGEFAKWIIVQSGGIEDDLFKNGVGFIIRHYHDQLQPFYDQYGLDEFSNSPNA